VQFHSFVHLDIIPESPGDSVAVTCSCDTFRNKSGAPRRHPFTGKTNRAIPDRQFPQASARCIHQCLVMRHFARLRAVVPVFPESNRDVPAHVVYEDSRNTLDDSRKRPSMVISIPSKNSGKRTFIAFGLFASEKGKCQYHRNNKCYHAERATVARASHIEEFGVSDDERRNERDEEDAGDRELAEARNREGKRALRKVSSCFHYSQY
jgi:hypothetical protein